MGSEQGDQGVDNPNKSACSQSCHRVDHRCLDHPQDSWTLEDLASKVGIEESVLRGSDWDGGQTCQCPFGCVRRLLCNV